MCCAVNWVFLDRPIWRISVRLSDRSKVTQHKINFIKNCPQWGLNSQPPDHQSHALPTVLSHYLVVDVNHQGLYKGVFTLSETENDFCSKTNEMAKSSHCDWLLLAISSVSLQKSFLVSLSVKTPLSHALLILEINKVQHVKWCMKQKKAHFRYLQQIPPKLS